MTRTGEQAIAWMRNEQLHGGPNWAGKCLMDVRMSLDIDSMYGWAGLAWDRAQFKHRVSRGAQVPRGVAAFWKGGSEGYGHIVLSTGGGMCYSNDVRRRGHIDLVSIDSITANWGQAFQGWTEDLNGVHYFNPHPDAEWAKGPVYVHKLYKGSKDSDSVRRLQKRLLDHNDVPAKGVRITGNWYDGTTNAVKYWQREVSQIDRKDETYDGTRLSNRQAAALFGHRYDLIEHEERKGKKR